MIDMGSFSRAANRASKSQQDVNKSPCSSHNLLSCTLSLDSLYATYWKGDAVLLQQQCCFANYKGRVRGLVLLG
jgi:hypothetical protein